MSNKTYIKFDLNKYFLKSIVILVFILVLNYGSYLINIINENVSYISLIEEKMLNQTLKYENYISLIEDKLFNQTLKYEKFNKLTCNIYLNTFLNKSLNFLEYNIYLEMCKDYWNNDEIALYNTYMEFLKFIQNTCNGNIYFKDNHGSDAYLLASLNGQLEIMKYLEKEHNWDIHVKDNNGYDAYLSASYNGQLKIMKYLEKEHNWDIHLKNNNGYDAYLLASYNGHLEIIKYLEKNIIGTSMLKIMMEMMHIY